MGIRSETQEKILDFNMKLACLIPAVFAAPPFSLADFAAMQKQPNQIGIEPFLNGLDPAIDQMPLIQMLVGSNNKNEDTDVSAEVAGTNTIVKANIEMPKPLEAWQGRSASLEEFEEGKQAADDIRSVILGLPQFKDRKIDPYALAQAFGDPSRSSPAGSRCSTRTPTRAT